MLSGINADIKFQEKTYHVQTEDGGLQNPVVVTMLFEGGAILASRKTSYADRLKVENLSDEIRELIKKQHKAVVEDLLAGKFTGTKTADQTTAARGKKTAKKTLDDLILDFFSTKKENTAS